MENFCNTSTANCSTYLSSYLLTSTPSSTLMASPQSTPAVIPIIQENDNYPHTSIIDIFLPGFSMMSSVLSKTTGLDSSIYIPKVAAFFALLWLVVRIYNQIKKLIEDHFMSSLDVRVDDEMYDMLMAWVASQSFSQTSRKFLAQTDITSAFAGQWQDWDSYSDHNAVQFDDEGNPVAQNARKLKQYKTTPSFGSHYFWYSGRFLVFRREKNTSAIERVGKSEEISIHSLGRNPAILKTLLDECRLAFVKSDMNKTIIYKATFSESAAWWDRTASRISRPFSTVVLDESVKQSLLQDMRDYLQPYTQRWYSNRGIPYRRGYLLHGPPGTGKSSLSFAIAGYFLLKIYIISLNAAGLTEGRLEHLFSMIPRQCVVLLEDIDTAGLTHSRKIEDSESESDESDDDNELTPEQKIAKEKVRLKKESKKGAPPSGKSNISLSSLLNILDGVASQEGRILIMTTNHIKKLDEALIRPGRVDMTIKFDLASTEMVTTIFRSIYVTLEGDHPVPPKFSASAINNAANSTPSLDSLPTDFVLTAKNLADKAREEIEFEMHKTREEAKVLVLAGEFGAIVPSRKFSPAEIQGYLLKHKRMPEEAVEGAAAWVEKKGAEKKKKEEERKKAKEQRKEKEKKKKKKKNWWKERSA